MNDKHTDEQISTKVASSRTLTHLRHCVRTHEYVDTCAHTHTHAHSQTYIRTHTFYLSMHKGVSIYIHITYYIYTCLGYSCQAPLMHATISYCSVSYARHVQHDISEHSLFPKLAQWGQASTVSHMPVHCDSAPLTID